MATKALDFGFWGVTLLTLVLALVGVVLTAHGVDAMWCVWMTALSISWLLFWFLAALGVFEDSNRRKSYRH